MPSAVAPAETSRGAPTTRTGSGAERREGSVAEYERSRTIRVPEDDVFAFVAAPGNLATFVPTVTAVEPEADGRVRIRGEHGGRSYEDEGWFHTDPDRRRLEWGAEEREYSGWLTVS